MEDRKMSETVWIKGETIACSAQTKPESVNGEVVYNVGNVYVPLAFIPTIGSQGVLIRATYKAIKRGGIVLGHMLGTIKATLANAEKYGETYAITYGGQTVETAAAAAAAAKGFQTAASLIETAKTGLPRSINSNLADRIGEQSIMREYGSDSVTVANIR
jgi:hypothetical protein